MTTGLYVELHQNKEVGEEYLWFDALAESMLDELISRVIRLMPLLILLNAVMVPLGSKKNIESNRKLLQGRVYG